MSDIKEDGTIINIPISDTERIRVNVNDYTVLNRELLIKDDLWMNASTHFLIPRQAIPELVKILKENYPQLFKE